MSGLVCLQGGGEFSPGCREMDADLVRRTPGRVVVTALAGAVGSDYRTATANGVRHFRAVGADDVVAAPDVREDPDGALEALGSARLLVLPGGSPSRLLSALQETGAGAAVAAVLAAGGTVMGASAGAMVLCSWTVLPDRRGRDGAPAVAAGLGLVPDLVVLPHWDGRGRADWVSAVQAAAPEGTLLLGLAEESGVLVDESGLVPVGRSAARLVVESRDLPLGRTWSNTDERGTA